MCEQCETRPWETCECGCGKAKGRRGCTAHSSRSKKLCGKNAVAGRHTCQTHGGNAARGIFSENYKNGKFVKAGIPLRYLEVAQAALDRPEAKKLDRQMALCDAREVELFTQMDSGEHGEVWAGIQNAIQEAKLCLESDNGAGAEASLESLEGLTQAGQTVSESWGELRDLWEQKRRMADTSARIAFRASVSMSYEQVMTLVSFIILTAREFIEDEDRLREFGTKMESFGRQGRHGSGAVRKFN